jgi:hypothetical protein
MAKIGALPERLRRRNLDNPAESLRSDLDNPASLSARCLDWFRKPERYHGLAAKKARELAVKYRRRV